MSAALWIVGSLTLLLYPSLPGVPRAHLSWDVGISAFALGWGICSLLLIDWGRSHPLLVHVSSGAAIAVIAAAVAATGGATSPAWIFLFWVSIFSAYFFDPPVAVGYLLACVIAQSLPLLYDGRIAHDSFIAQLLTASAGYVSIGLGIIVARTLFERMRAHAERLAAEQSALRRVATAVVGGEPPERVYAVAAKELASLLGADLAAILQVTSAGGRVAGSWDNGNTSPLQPGSYVPIAPDSDFERALLRREPVRNGTQPDDPFPRQLGCSSTLIVPVTVRDVLWGAVAVGSCGHDRFDTGDEQQLVAFGELIASAIANVEDHARLAAQALSDPLTGLANQRALNQRLAAEAAGAQRHGRPLAVAMLDIDNFKEINDTGGHDAGDDALRTLARCLSSVARAEDVVGRTGGDEFMWILPDTTHEQALAAVDRARELIAGGVEGPLPVTTSAGICDSRAASDPVELVRLADIALYASKARGRDRATVYVPGLSTELAPLDR